MKKLLGNTDPARPDLMTAEDATYLVIHRRQMRLSYGATCVDCGESHPLALDPWRLPVRCYECGASAAGRPISEPHHLGGRPSPFRAVPVPLNQHQVLTLLQSCWWRPRHEPGSPYAVAFDVGALRGVTLGWEAKS